MVITFDVVNDDVLKLPSDLLLLKFAQAPYGLDWKVASQLVALGKCSVEDIRPAPGEAVIFDAPPQVAAKRVMFVGTQGLYLFGYEEMHEFAGRAVAILAERCPEVECITTTVHGVGYGLDAGESVQHLALGFLEGIRSAPRSNLSRVTFADRSPALFRVISTALHSMGVRTGASAPGSVEPPLTSWSGMYGETRSQKPSLPDKSHAFVAIPFSDEFQDVYEFGIYAPVRRIGYICEKVDQISFTGDILRQIQERIHSAKFMIADLTGARPNVYLEVGYAWGRDIPVIFLAREGETLHFDVKTHRCIYYKTIGQLSRDLEKLISELYGRGEKALP